MTLTIGSLTASATLSAANVVTGTGIFDDLMETAQLHLDAQFNLGRITSVDYAKVYLGLVQSVLTASVGYTLGVEKGNSESTLVFQKEVTEFAQTGVSTKTTPTSNSILGAQALLTAEQTTLTAEQTTLAFQKEVTEFAQTGVSTKIAPTADSILGAQALLTVEQTTLLFQKEVTEFAQTGVSTKTAPTAGSILGAQALLTAEQAKGFKWNADQKYLKTILDAWAINISTAGVAATGVDAIKETGVASVNVKIANAEPTG